MSPAMKATWSRTLLTMAWLNGACSADVAPEPEPTLHTKGAFVAVAADDGDLQLLRTLAVLGKGSPDETFFVTRYGERPRTYEEAAAIAKRRDLTGASLVTLLGGNYFDDREWRVVWFRSLSSEEESAFR